MKKVLLILGFSTSVHSLFGAAESKNQTLEFINDTGKALNIRVSYGSGPGAMTYLTDPERFYGKDSNITHLLSSSTPQIFSPSVKIGDRYLKTDGPSANFNIKHLGPAGTVNVRVFPDGVTEFTPEQSVAAFSVSGLPETPRLTFRLKNKDFVDPDAERRKFYPNYNEALNPRSIVRGDLALWIYPNIL